MRGLHIEAAADVLATYLIHKECQNNLAPITAWVEKLTRMASLAYDAENEKLVSLLPLQYNPLCKASAC